MVHYLASEFQSELSPPLFSLWTESACFKKQEELPEKEETCFLPRPLRGRKECLYAVSSLFLFSSPVRHFIPNFLFVIGPPFIPRPTSYSREGGTPVKRRRGLLRNGTRGVYAQRPLQKIYIFEGKKIKFRAKFSKTGGCERGAGAEVGFPGGLPLRRRGYRYGSSR